MNARLRKVLYCVAGLVITAAVSVALTVLVMNNQKSERVILDAETYQKYDQYSPLIELADVIEQKYYGEEKSSEALLNGAMQGMIASLGDPYAAYYTEEEYTEFLLELDGAYHGIGALIGQPAEAGVPVLKIYDESPAALAGVQVNDIIIKADGQALSGLTLEEIEQLFTGAEGSVIELEILRGEETLRLSITRGAVQTDRVEHKLFLQYTGYIKIDKFSGTVVEEFNEAVRDLSDRGMRSLVIDIRNNPGGELDKVVSIADALLPECVIVSVKGHSEDTEIYRSDEDGLTVPVAILVNENSASASEILAAAIQENGRGLVVGANTYGKGVVQTTMQLQSNNGWVKLTTAAYYTPNDNTVESNGVTPDIDIDLADDLKDLPIELIEQEDDAQLWAALDEVREQADALDEAA